MSRIPCKKCKSCGFYHDLSVATCDECGADLKSTPALMIETDDIPIEKYGEIDENVAVFVQKCSACGALNFTADKQDPVKVCHNCHKTRVAAIEPEEYMEIPGEPAGQKGAVKDETNSDTSHLADKENRAANVVFAGDDDDDDDDDESAQWQGILGNIRRSVGAVELQHERKIEALQVNENSIATTDDNDDDEDISDWSGILGTKPVPKKVAVDQPKLAITLTAIRFGRLSFTVEAKDNERYMLGRSANQSEFLSYDGRVGNEHCYLCFKNGAWYVKDNHSSNGTAVNSRDIGLNGESILNDGDELKLGHHSDSMAFRITIR